MLHDLQRRLASLDRPARLSGSPVTAYHAAAGVCLISATRALRAMRLVACHTDWRD